MHSQGGKIDCKENFMELYKLKKSKSFSWKEFNTKRLGYFFPGTNSILKG